MSSGKQDPAFRIDGETSQNAADRAGEPEAAGRIKKKEQAFSDPVMLALGPEAAPLDDG